MFCIFKLWKHIDNCTNICIYMYTRTKARRQNQLPTQEGRHDSTSTSSKRGKAVKNRRISVYIFIYFIGILHWNVGKFQYFSFLNDITQMVVGVKVSHPLPTHSLKSSSPIKSLTWLHPLAFIHVFFLFPFSHSQKCSVIMSWIFSKPCEIICSSLPWIAVCPLVRATQQIFPKQGYLPYCDIPE